MTEDNHSQLEDTFKILVATDIHLGFAEKNAIRGQDSFVTFEEILQLASKNKVDFLLLGGDLFHESRPSPYCINKCLELLRKYCLGDNPVQIEFLSDQSYHFQTQRHSIVNYEDPNLNVSIPVFSIHGNHDDPTGNKQISVLDVIAASGLINYFGRLNDYKMINIKPILLKKGKSKLAIYGLSHIKDERLGRLFRDKKVLMKRPQGEDWFNILVLHQNRAARGAKNYIPETCIPSFIDLVIWGHEHDCRIAPEQIEKGIYICQPGSSVATSLAAGESIKKHVGLLQVYLNSFKMIALPLKTVRPFVIDEFFLESPASENYQLAKPSDQAIEMVKQKIDEMIDAIKSQHKDESKPAPLPLIRLKVMYHNDGQMFNPIRIGMHFLSRVANPDDMIKLISMAAKEKRVKSNYDLDDEDLRQFEDVNAWATCVEDIIVKYLDTDERKKGMSILSVKGLVDSVSRFVKYEDAEVLPGLVE
uniref:Mre11 DNA-binding domain-containing protein n=1 Tax=Photinus pyralis TaxID=7054 RepID=A0A1Y1N0S8_PHOPY